MMCCPLNILGFFTLKRLIINEIVKRLLLTEKGKNT